MKCKSSCIEGKRKLIINIFLKTLSSVVIAGPGAMKSLQYITLETVIKEVKKYTNTIVALTVARG